MLQYLRPGIRTMAAYTPGEQPAGHDFIKLNTNENPYPPSPRVLAAIQEAATGERLRRYPDPVGTAFRRTAGRVLDVDPDGIVIGNGSDDVLTILTRAFVPQGGVVASPTPSYLLYRTLADLQGATLQTVAFTPEWSLPTPWPVRGAHLTYLANPNSPSGTVVPQTALENLLETLDGPLVIDEAYADFATANALTLARRPKSRAIVTRTLSKSYGLAGIRFGFAVTSPDLARELTKVKDSYNCDVLSLAAAQAALEDQDYLHATTARILATRGRMERELAALGFKVTPSHANFVWCQREQPVRPLYEGLKRVGILVRYMVYAGYGEGLRISVGTESDIDRLMAELRTLV